MKPAAAKKPRIRIAVLESDPLRFVGFRALFDTESDLEILASSIPEVPSLGVVDVVLLGSRNGVNLFDTMAGLKASRPDLKIIVTGSGADDETILKALAAGAKGYVDEAASPRVRPGHPHDPSGIGVGSPCSSSGLPPRRDRSSPPAA